MINIIQKMKDIFVCASEKIAIRDNSAAREKINKSLMNKSDEKWPRIVGIDRQRHST